MSLYDAGFVALAASPRGAGTLEQPPTASARLSNPLCGDEIELDVRVEDGVIREVAHRARGCAIVRVSASLLAEHCNGLGAERARALATALDAGLSRRAPLPDDFRTMSAVVLLPARRRCALLPWAALVEALAAVVA